MSRGRNIHLCMHSKPANMAKWLVRRIIRIEELYKFLRSRWSLSIVHWHRGLPFDKLHMVTPLAVRSIRFRPHV